VHCWSAIRRRWPRRSFSSNTSSATRFISST
jgi:hypothetical protein